MTTNAQTSKPSRLWIASEIYFPEQTSTGYLLTTLAESLAAEFPVKVLCAQPSYELRGSVAPKREWVNEVEIFRSSHPRFNRDRLVGRAVNVLVVTTQIFVQALRQLQRSDVVIVVTNPPLLPFVIWLAATIRRASVALLVHDLYPEAAILAGILPKSSILSRIWRRASDWLFRRMDRIIVLGRDTAELIAARMPDGAARIRVIGNWADIDEISPGEPSENALLQSLGLTECFVLGYSGNMGRVHDIELLLDAARDLRTSAPEVRVLFVGSGAKAGMVDVAAREPGSNVIMVGPRHRSEQNVFLNACHVAVMALAPGMAGVGVPSRLYNILAAGRPVIAAVDLQSEPARIIREEGIGAQTAPGDVTAFVRAVKRAYADRAASREAGERARRAAVDRFGRASVLSSYRDLVHEIQATSER